MKYARCYADADGETHFEDVEVELAEAEPGRAQKSAQIPGGDIDIARLPVGVFEDWHPTPFSWIGAVLQGTVEVEVSDGEVRRFTVGDLHVHEDVDGKGHTTRSVGEDDLVVIRTRLV
jgi:hypothetical protein